MAPKIDEVGTDHAGMCRELNQHADNLDTVTKRVEQARHHAREAGLAVHGDQIMEPGPEPTPPAPLPSDKPATPEQQQAHAAGTQAQAAYARKVKAYQECSQTITDARNVENSSLGVLNRFVSGLVEKSPFTVTDVMTGLAGGSCDSHQRLPGHGHEHRQQRQARTSRTPHAQPEPQLAATSTSSSDPRHAFRQHARGAEQGHSDQDCKARR